MSRGRERMNLAGLICGLVGGLLIVYALPLTRSNYRLVETSNHHVAICFNEKTVEAGYGGPLIVSDKPCPDGIGPSAAPVIGAERPIFVPLGVGLIVLGFILQLPSAWDSVRHTT